MCSVRSHNILSEVPFIDVQIPAPGSTGPGAELLDQRGRGVYAPLIISTMDTIVKCLVLQKRVKEGECQPLVPIWWHPSVTLTEKHHEFSTRIIVLGNKHSTKTRVCFQ